MVIAKIIPVAIKLFKSVINFKFPEDSLEMELKEFLEMKNQGNEIAAY